MTTQESVVLIAGLATIVAINWYFFAPRAAVGATAAGATQAIDIKVLGGYSPGTVRAKRGVPLRIVFDRQENSACSEEVVIPAFGVRKFLPAFARTTVDVVPDKAGKFDITCGMSMLHGTLEVED
jgi:plastocyanin domain-containing protein